MVATSVNPKH